MDLRDVAGNTCDGLHIASLAGTWIAAVAGFGGMRDHSGTLTFAPRLPSRLERLAFSLRVRGRVLKVVATKSEATYELVEGDRLEIAHHGTALFVAPREPVTRRIPPAPSRPAPTQPRGREPAPRRASA
jgi:alpha,alpha-trehalose phosphorylase